MRSHGGGAPFNNLFHDCAQGPHGAPRIDFAGHAQALGAQAEHVANVAELETAMQRARAATRTCVIVIDTDPARTTDDGGWWWEVAVPQVSPRETVREARAQYDARIAARADPAGAQRRASSHGDESEPTHHE